MSDDDVDDLLDELDEADAADPSQIELIAPPLSAAAAEPVSHPPAPVRNEQPPAPLGPGAAPPSDGSAAPPEDEPCCCLRTDEEAVSVLLRFFCGCLLQSRYRTLEGAANAADKEEALAALDGLADTLASRLSVAHMGGRDELQSP